MLLHLQREGRDEVGGRREAGWEEWKGGGKNIGQVCSSLDILAVYLPTPGSAFMSSSAVVGIFPPKSATT